VNTIVQVMVVALLTRVVVMIAMLVHTVTRNALVMVIAQIHSVRALRFGKAHFVKCQDALMIVQGMEYATVFFVNVLVSQVGREVIAVCTIAQENQAALVEVSAQKSTVLPPVETALQAGWVLHVMMLALMVHKFLWIVAYAFVIRVGRVKAVILSAWDMDHVKRVNVFVTHCVVGEVNYVKYQVVLE